MEERKKGRDKDRAKGDRNKLKYGLAGL